MIIKRNPQRQKELNKLYSKARVYKTKHHKYKWLVIFGRMPPGRYYVCADQGELK